MPRTGLILLLGLGLAPGSAYALLIWRDYLNLWAGGHLALSGRLALVFGPLA